MTAVSWVLVASALLLAGGRATPATSTAPPARRRPSLRGLQTIAAVAAAAAAVVAAGIPAGALAALGLAPAAFVVVGRLHDRPPTARPDRQLALCLDLVAVALRAGQPLPAALVLAAPGDGGGAAPLLRVAGLLRLGASPHQAWAQLTDHPVLGPVAAAGRRSAESGIRLADAFEQQAVDVRDRLAAAAAARARRLEVLVAAPLGLCFLPSFVCLGIVPTVIGVAAGVLGR